MAMNGANVMAIDISGGMCDLTRRAAEINGVTIDVRNISAVNTGLPDNEFDLVVGQVSLHHLPLKSAGLELKRVLKPNGEAIFLEPIHSYKWFYKLRGILPLACLESPGGGALRRDEIESLGQLFGKLEVTYFGFFERLRRLPFFRWASGALYAMDSIVLRLPLMKKFASHALITLTKTID